MLKDLEKILKKNKSIFLVILCGLIVIGAIIYINNKNVSESFHYPEFITIRTVDGDKLTNESPENVNIPIVKNISQMEPDDLKQSSDDYPSSDIKEKVEPSDNIANYEVAAEEAAREVERNGGSAQDQAIAAAKAARESDATIEQQIQSAGKAASNAGTSMVVQENIKNIVRQQVNPNNNNMESHTSDGVSIPNNTPNTVTETDNTGTFIYNLNKNNSCGSKKIHYEIITADDNLNNYNTSDPYNQTYSNPQLDGKYGWLAKKNSKNEFIQLDIGYNAWLSGIITQTRGNHNEYVTTYKIQTSLDGENWTDHSRIFNGNRKNDYNKTKSTSILRDQVETRYVRILPQSWYGRIAMRVGIEIINKCQDNNDLEIDGQNYLEVSRENIRDCYTKCNNNTDCGGIHYSDVDKKCYFRKDGSCNMVKDETSDCYTKLRKNDETVDEGFLDYMSGFTQNCSVWKK